VACAVALHLHSQGHDDRANIHTHIPLTLLLLHQFLVMTCGRYGDPKKLEANSPDQAFATLFRDQCAVKFLEAHAAMLGRYAEVSVRTTARVYLWACPKQFRDFEHDL
jgi:hypothetical protein